MESIIATLAWFLLALSFAVAQTEQTALTVIPTVAKSDSDSNLTHTTATVTPSNSTVHPTVISNMTENTTPFASTTKDNDTFTRNTTATPAQSTSHLQTSQSTTITTPVTKSTSPTTTTPGTHTPTFTAMTTPAKHTTESYTSTPGTTVITTANSSHTVNTTSDSLGRTTQALRLNVSERNMTILFSAVLGVFALTLVAFMFHKCKHKIQYLHEPLHNTDGTDQYVADDDTLVISGGLYDGHPIYDNVPTVSTNESQFRLEFLH